MGCGAAAASLPAPAQRDNGEASPARSQGSDIIGAKTALTVADPLSRNNDQAAHVWPVVLKSILPETGAQPIVSDLESERSTEAWNQVVVLSPTCDDAADTPGELKSFIDSKQDKATYGSSSNSIGTTSLSSKRDDQPLLEEDDQSIGTITRMELRAVSIGASSRCSKRDSNSSENGSDESPTSTVATNYLGNGAPSPSTSLTNSTMMSSPSPSCSAGQSKQFAALIKAVSNGDLNEVVRILQNSDPALPNLRQRGTRALHEACKHGHLPIVVELLSSRAEVNAPNRSGCSPLHLAMLCKEKLAAGEIMRCLVSTSAHVNAVNGRMDTPLHYATYCKPSSGSKDVLISLLAQRAMVNTRNKSADTPLINAALHDDSEAVKMLLKAKADICHRNCKDRSAQDIAREAGCTQALHVLREIHDLLDRVTAAGAEGAVSANAAVNVELGRQALLAECYENVAVSAVADMDAASRTRLAEQAISMLHQALANKPEPPQDASPSQQFLQALLRLRLVSRSSSGAAFLNAAGVPEMMDSIEMQVKDHHIGRKELDDLKASLHATE